MNKQLKTVKKLLFTLAVGCVSLSAVASNTPGDEEAQLSMSSAEKSGSVVVRAWNLSASAPATIKVLNKYGTAVYEEDLTSGVDHTKRYDFSQMKSGRYSLVLESQTGIATRQFVVGMNGAVREDETEKFANFTPSITMKASEQVVRVLFKNPAEAPLTVALIDSNGNVIHSDKVEGNQSYAKLLNMKQVASGAYQVKVANYDYKHVVRINR